MQVAMGISGRKLFLGMLWWICKCRVRAGYFLG